MSQFAINNSVRQAWLQDSEMFLNPRKSNLVYVGLDWSPEDCEEIHEQIERFMERARELDAMKSANRRSLIKYTVTLAGMIAAASLSFF